MPIRWKIFSVVGVVVVVFGTIWLVYHSRTFSVSQPSFSQRGSAGSTTETEIASVEENDILVSTVPETAPAENMPTPSIAPTPDATQQKNTTASTQESETSKNADVMSRKRTALKITNKLVSFGFTASSGERKIDTVVVHSSYNNRGGDPFSLEKIIQEYKDADVSPHYIITRGGDAYRLVRENDIAWHAGVSKMKDGRTNVNQFSIGIEMIGTEESGYRDEQYGALQILLQDIKSRQNIKYVVGHDDIAPDRKTDPWKFDWKKL